jgi:hypothetical protein
MKNKFEYAFDDEPVARFFYDRDNRIIEIGFNAYYNLVEYVEKNVYLPLKIGKVQKAGKAVSQSLGNWRGIWVLSI